MIFRQTQTQILSLSREGGVDLQLMVFFYPRRAENRTFRPPVTQKQKNIFKFQKRLKIVEISLASLNVMPGSSLCAILRWEATSVLAVLFLGGGTLRLAAR